MSELLNLITVLKKKTETLKVLDRNCKFDLFERIENIDELTLESRRELEDAFVDFNLLDKEKIQAERNKMLVKDNIPQYYYNYDFKMNYLEKHTDYQEKTKRVCRVFFRKMATIEKQLGKDFYDFDGEQVEKVLKSFKASTVRSLQNTTSLLGKYVEHAISAGVTKRKSNPLLNFANQEILSTLIDELASERMFFEKEEVMAMAINSENPQDGVILALIYDGVSPKDNFDELVNLRVDNVDWDGKKIFINGREKALKISDETLFLLKGAVDVDTYFSINGDRVRSYKIEPTDFVIRGLRNKGNKPASWRNVNQRILRMAEIFEEDYLNATNVSTSGQIEYATNLYSQDEDLGDEAIVMALENANQNVNKSAIFALKKKIKTYKGIHISN